VAHGSRAGVKECKNIQTLLCLMNHMELDEGIFAETHTVCGNPGIDEERTEIHGRPKFFQGIEER